MSAELIPEPDTQSLPTTGAVLDDLSKELPTALHAEEQIISAVLLHPEKIHTVMGEVEPFHFFDRRYRVVLATMYALVEDRVEPDAIALATRINDAGEHGAFRKPDFPSDSWAFLFLSDTLDASTFVTAPQLDYCIRLVRQKYELRQAARFGKTLASQAKAAVDGESFWEWATQQFYNLRGESAEDQTHSLKGQVSDAFKRIQQRYENKEPITGIPSRFDDLDSMTTGLHKKELAILAGRPSMGKTSLAFGIGVNAAESEARGIIFSSEESKEAATEKMLAARARVDNQRLRTGQIGASHIPALTQAAAELARLPLEINDEGGISVARIASVCRRVKAESGLDFIIIDYLQRITATGPDGKQLRREEEVHTIAKSLKNLAKELDIHVLALAQLNRDLEKRADKRPQMSDLRESGAIEQEADLIMFVYRDEYYNEHTEDAGIAEVIIGKQRRGPLGTCRLRFTANCTRFDNLGPGEGYY